MSEPTDLSKQTSKQPPKLLSEVAYDRLKAEYEEKTKNDDVIALTFEEREMLVRALMVYLFALLGRESKKIEIEEIDITHAASKLVQNTYNGHSYLACTWSSAILNTGAAVAGIVGYDTMLRGLGAGAHSFSSVGAITQESQAAERQGKQNKYEASKRFAQESNSYARESRSHQGELRKSVQEYIQAISQIVRQIWMH